MSTWGGGVARVNVRVLLMALYHSATYIGSCPLLRNVNKQMRCGSLQDLTMMGSVKLMIGRQMTTGGGIAIRRRQGVGGL